MENIGEDADRLLSRPETEETEPSDPVSRCSDDGERVIRPSFPAWGPGPVSAPAPSLPPATLPAAAAATEIFAGDQIRVPPPRPVTRLRAHYSWVPGNVSPPPWQCQVCPALFAAVDALATHFHQYHLNPHHLSQEDRRKYRLSNFLVNTNEEAEFKTEFPGLYRCHECFNVFSFPVSLREHLLAHSQPPAMVMSKIPSKFSREDFEDVSPRKRSRRSYKENNFEENQDIRKPEKINNNLNRNKRIRTRLKSNTKITEINSDPSDEYNSDSDFDGDKISIEKQKAKRNFRDSKRRRVSSKRFSLNGLSEVDYTKAFLDPDEELDIEKKAKKTKARNVKRSSTKNKKQSTKQNPETFPNDVQTSWNEIKEASMKTKEVTKVARRSQKQEKKWRFKIIDHSKHHSVVQHLTTPSQDFICLSCNQSFSSYTCLSQHRIICDKRKKSLWINNDASSRRHHDVKEEIVNNCSEDIFHYVTGAVTNIPETTFNNMHGKIADLNTEDAQKLSRNHLNEIGLVKLNFSGNWSVKDVWESGCWEPKEDQLTWQDYELSSEIFKSKNETQGVSDTDKTEADQAAPEPDNDEVHKLTEKLTTQIVGRKAPIITNPAMDRQMVMAMSKMHWTEQKYIKQRIDTNLTTKRNKRLSVGGESIRQSNITSILDLKQTGKSVKYMKQAERESLSKPLIGEEGRVEGSLSGEWELGHSYVCSVCGVEYDDMMEILHHKWEAHPRCLVSHFSVRDNVTKPSDLMYPQVGPSTVKREAENSDSRETVLLKCSKCQMEFIKNEDFYHHILECGGVDDLVETRRKKKKKKRMGGGLKSTVRMLKQADAHQEGTDTGDEQSPKKKPRPPPKVVQPVPLIPTHTRTTRYKETMKKEAKKIAAKERRIKKKGSRKSKEELTEQRRIVAEVLDKVLSDVEKIRRKSSKIRAKSKPGIPSKEEVQLNSSMETVQLNNLNRGKIKSNHRTRERVFNSRIGRIRREAKVKTYKEDSDSDSEPSTKHREDESSENLHASIESEALAAPKTVLVTVVNDEILSTLTDIEKMREEPTDALASAEAPLPSPGGVKISENSPRILKRLMSTLVSDAQVTALGNGVEEQAKHRSRQQFSVETKMTAISRIEAGERQVDIARDLDIGVSMLESWWIRKSDIRSNYVNKLANGLHDEDFLGKKAPHKAKSLALKTIPVSVKAEAIESVSRGQSPGKVAKELGVSPSQVSFWIRRKDKILKRHRNNSLSDPISINAGDEQTETSKKSYSLQFKKRVIERISAGEEISAVAKKLKIRENTVEVWWIRKDQILRRQDDFIPNTNSSVETKDDTTEAPPLAPEPQEKVHDAFTSETAVNGIFEDAGKDLKKTDPEEEDLERHERQARSRRSVSSGTLAAGSGLTSRWCSMPLEVKQTALRRLEAGLTQAVVARDLGVSLSTVASWWRKKDSILGVISTNAESEDCLNSPSESNTSSDIQEQNLSHDLPHDAETNNPAEIEEEVMSSPTKEPTSQIDDLGILELEQLMTDESEAEMKSANDISTRNTNLEDNDETEEPNPNDSKNHEETSDEEKNSDLDDLDDDDARIPEALSLTPRPRSVISLTSTPRPQSGLHLIVSSYCSSSDDEL